SQPIRPPDGAGRLELLFLRCTGMEDDRHLAIVGVFALAGSGEFEEGCRSKNEAVAPEDETVGAPRRLLDSVHGNIYDFNRDKGFFNRSCVRTRFEVGGDGLLAIAAAPKCEDGNCEKE